MSKKKIIGLTGPSQYSPELREMIKDTLDAIIIEINHDGEDVATICNLCDAFVLGGGVDIYPFTLNKGRKIEYYRHISHGNGYTKFDRKRDDRELAILAHVRETGKKVLGVCRGHQMILSHAGLYLIPDIHYSEIAHSPQGIELQNEPIHYIEPVDGSDFIQQGELVNSFHHQAISYCAKTDYSKFGIKVLAVAYTLFQDEKTQAQQIIELAKGKNFICCQWHPELDYDKNPTSAKVLTEFKNLLNS